MHFEYSPYIVPLAISAVISGWVAYYAWRRRSAPHILVLVLMAFAILEWSIGYALEIAGADLATKVIWGKSQYIGITIAPLAWFLYAFYQVNSDKRLKWTHILLLAAIPLITVGLAFTTDLHGLVWSSIDIQRSGSFSALALEYGPWFWVFSVYSYTLLLLGTIMIFRSLVRARGIYRGQTIAAIVAVLAPWIGNALYLSGLSPIPNLDLTPFAFTITVAALALGIFGFRLADLSPIARDFIVDEMRDGMIVVNAHGRIADLNPAAAHMIGFPASQAIGKPVQDVFSPWPNLLVHIQDSVEDSDVITTGEGEAQRRYEVRIFPLIDRQQLPMGRVLTIRSLGESSIPQPRFAVRAVEPGLRAQVETSTVMKKRRQIPVLGWLVDYILTPVKTDLKSPPGISPKWFQARERSFTLILRIAALIGLVALVLAPSFTTLKITIPFSIIIALMWFLGLARNIDFNLRAYIFLVLLYGLAFFETLNFGFSVESFTFFMGLIVCAVLLLGRNGGLLAFLVGFTTLIIFGIIIGQGRYLPPNSLGGIATPATVQRALTSLVVFTATAVALIASATILMESLNRAWQLETQALNLLQQERDLLDQRVQERTQALAEARDQAVRSNDELRKYFRAIEQTGSTVVITDTNGTIEYVNPRFSVITGYNKEEAIGQNPRILKSGQQDEAFYRTMWQTISSGQIWHGEFLNRRKDGSTFWESATIAPVLDSEGKITHYVGIKDDISAIKQTQEALALARDQALEASHLKSQLLSRVSHELRTPLGGVLGYAELLKEDAFGTLNPEQKGAITQVISSTNYLTNLVNDLLDQAQIESKRLTLHMDMFSPAAMLLEVEARLAVLARNKGIGLLTELSPELPASLFNDEHRLQQILINLGGNAIKFTKTGNVRIRLYPSGSTHWVMEVSDTGPGIPPEAQKFIYEPFRQVDNTITRENRGTGLGLTIVKQLVDLLDGTISLESAVGTGSTFTVMLPFQKVQTSQT